MIRTPRRRSGQSLVEYLLGISVLAIGLAAALGRDGGIDAMLLRCRRHRRGAPAIEHCRIGNRRRQYQPHFIERQVRIIGHGSQSVGP